ncbi:hypothetical protein FFLO_00184 [Filobasidium floriforme]|uniref:Uncharacterized protein n=1 Tax=Filobasidium floriforme TaxID=5210 RepID=A0A8K0JRZ0_9TREE|nr:uncharacterized protein HD553DRAFT_307993 [Filobasidium floriforme]KAG7579976.1 hypothetical protein FFLO_00184 [Filobasidium floriforme]KAH8087376.1 hypothetical protein HD553DRAFT_307993 [Filobasidium floriforme]
MLAHMTPFPNDDKLAPPPDYDSLTLNDDLDHASPTLLNNYRENAEAGPSDPAAQPLIPVFGNAVAADYRLSLDFHYESTLSTNLVIRETTNGRDFYHVQVSEWNWGNPDVILRRRTRAGVVVGSAEFRWGRDIQIRLGGRGIKGDPEGETRGAVMTNDSRWLTHNKYTLVIPSIGPSVTGTSSKEKDKLVTPGGRTLIFTRTQSDKDGIVGVQQKLAFQHYKVQDATTGKVLAMWTERRIIDVVIKGTLRLVTQDQASSLAGPIGVGERRMMDEKWEAGGNAGEDHDEDGLNQEEIDWIVLAFASLAEKTRRRRE